MAAVKNKTKGSDISVEEKLSVLYELQKVHSEIDKIRTLRGELPLEVQDLEDDIAGLETRIEKYREEVNSLENNISTKKNEIVEAQALIEKYNDQQSNVRNNREFESLAKEIEYQHLEIELCEKRIKEYAAKISEKKIQIDSANEFLSEKNDDLNAKKEELEEIVADTQKDEDKLVKKSSTLEQKIEDRLLTAYKKIRKNARNGLCVVSVERDACGGCFNKIPPQRQLDIKSHKKIIVCEYCGRILIDSDILEGEAAKK